MDDANPFQCRAGNDGDCIWEDCPQLRDGEPVATGRSCPLEPWHLDEEGEPAMTTPDPTQAEREAAVTRARQVMLNYNLEHWGLCRGGCLDDCALLAAATGLEATARAAGRAEGPARLEALEGALNEAIPVLKGFCDDRFTVTADGYAEDAHGYTPQGIATLYKLAALRDARALLPEASGGRD